MEYTKQDMIDCYARAIMTYGEYDGICYTQDEAIKYAKRDLFNE